MLYPLDVLYARAGVTEPAVRPTTAERVPPPYRGLLVHQNEMTSTLEAHFGGPVTVRVLSSFSKGQSYFRRVLLVLEGTGTPVAMGAIRLRLGMFRPAVRMQILRGQLPVGRILRDAGIEYQSRPTAYLEIIPNAEMMGVFWMPAPRVVYGRRTEVSLDATKVGDIVEVIPLV
jgi:chorismate-pyruvate lyase